MFSRVNGNVTEPQAPFDLNLDKPNHFKRTKNTKRTHPFFLKFQPSSLYFREKRSRNIIVIGYWSRQILKNPPAPACQGHQGCVIWNNSLFNNYQSFFQLSGYAVICSQGPKLVRSAPPDHEPRIRCTPKTLLILRLFSTYKKPEKRLPRRSKENQK